MARAFRTVLSNALASDVLADHPIGVLSDGTVIEVLRNDGAGTPAFELWSSVDGGVTWAKAISIANYVSPDTFCTQIRGDSIYCVSFKNGTVAAAVLLYRIDYTAATQTFALAVNGGTVSSGVANHYFADVRFEKDPTGRCWVASRTFQSAVEHRWKVYYSDDNGATWTFSLDFDTSTSNAATGTPMLAFQNRLVLFWGSSNGGDALYRRERLHTDGPTTWGAKTSTISISGIGSYSLDASPMVESPVKTGMLTVHGVSLLIARRVNESGSTLSYTTLTNSTAANLVWGSVSGRNDGWRWEGLLTTSALARRYASATDTAWTDPGNVTIPSPIATSLNSLGGCAPLNATVASDDGAIGIRRNVPPNREDVYVQLASAVLPATFPPLPARIIRDRKMMSPVQSY